MKSRKTEPKHSCADSETKDLLLRGPNFVSNSENFSFGGRPRACEASALTTELTAQLLPSLPPNPAKNPEARGLFVARSGRG